MLWMWTPLGNSKSPLKKSYMLPATRRARKPKPPGTERMAVEEPVGDVQVVDVLLEDVVAGHLGPDLPGADQVVGPLGLMGVLVKILPMFQATRPPMMRP